WDNGPFSTVGCSIGGGFLRQALGRLLEVLARREGVEVGVFLEASAVPVAAGNRLPQQADGVGGQALAQGLVGVGGPARRLAGGDGGGAAGAAAGQGGEPGGRPGGGGAPAGRHPRRVPGDAAER